jgi:hypothetical protein
MWDTPHLPRHASRPNLEYLVKNFAQLETQSPSKNKVSHLEIFATPSPQSCSSFFFSVHSCLEELFSKEFQGSMSVLWLGANWGYWDSVFDQGGGVHHKLLMFLTWIGSFACHWHRHQVQGTSVLRLIRRTRAIEVKQLAQGCKQRWQQRYTFHAKYFEQRWGRL